MSYLAIIDPRIFDDPTCKRAEYKVLWALGHRAQWRDPQWRGWCWPSLAQLTQDTGFSHPTVIKALKRLEAGGYIKVVRTRKPDGSQAPNRYYVIHDDPRAHVAQPERLPEFQVGRQENFTTDGVVKETEGGSRVKETEGGSKAAQGDGVYNGSKGPHGEGVYHNTKETSVEHEISSASVAVIKAHRNGNGPLPTVEEHLQTIFTAMATGAQDRTTRELVTQASVDVIFAHWAQTMGHPKALLDRERSRRIEKRLTENRGDVGEILYAIDGAAKDDWIMGRDPRSTKPYNGIETILRDRSQVERFASKCAGYRAGEPHPLVGRVQEWSRGQQGMN